jgi:hypothetical protein
MWCRTTAQTLAKVTREENRNNAGEEIVVEVLSNGEQMFVITAL